LEPTTLSKDETRILRTLSKVRTDLVFRSLTSCHQIPLPPTHDVIAFVQLSLPHKEKREGARGKVNEVAYVKL